MMIHNNLLQIWF